MQVANFFPLLGIKTADKRHADMNTYNFFANVILFLHVLFLAAVVGGLLLILIGGLLKWSWVRNFWLRMGHLLMIGIVVIQALLGVQCPLTTWEIQLRMAGGTPASSFVDNAGDAWEYYPAQDECGRFMQGLIFFNSWPQWVFPVVYGGFALIVVLSFGLVRPRMPGYKHIADRTQSAQAPISPVPK